MSNALPVVAVGSCPYVQGTHMTQQLDSPPQASVLGKRKKAPLLRPQLWIKTPDVALDLGQADQRAKPQHKIGCCAFCALN